MLLIQLVANVFVYDLVATSSLALGLAFAESADCKEVGKNSDGRSEAIAI